MRKVLLMMALAGLMSSCQKEKNIDENSADAISITAAIQEYKSRVLPYNTWAGLYDRNIAVRIGDEVKEYHIDKNGNMISENPFKWDGRKSVTVDVWYPYNEGAYSEEILTYDDQSINENYLSSDLVSVIGAEISPGNSNVTVAHRVAKVVCKVSNKENLPFEAKIILSGVSGLHNGEDEVTTTANYVALLAPQTITAGKAVLKVVMDDLSTWSSAKIDEEIVLEAGKTTYLEVEVSKDNIEVSVGDTGAWNNQDGGELTGTVVDDADVDA